MYVYIHRERDIDLPRLERPAGAHGGAEGRHVAAEQLDLKI